MLFLDTVLAFIALLALCFFYTGWGRVNSALSPLLAISTIVLYFTIAGIANCLIVAGWLFYIGCFALAGFAVWKNRQRPLRQTAALFITPGFLLFAGAGLVLLLYLGLRQPVFSDWDEFTLWGTAAKLMKLNNQLYTTTEMGWFWTATQMPGLFTLGYFAQFFGSGFAPWKVLWAYDVLFMACFTAVLAPASSKRWRLAVPLSALLLSIPFFFTVFTRLIHFNKAYISSYGDIPAGIWFGGTLAFYFSLTYLEEKRKWLILPVLGAFALVKDNTFAIVLVAAGIIAVDFMLQAKREKRKIAWPIGGFVLAFAVPLLFYKIWGMHTAWANSLNPVTGGSSTSMDIGTAVVVTVKELLGFAPRSENLNLTLEILVKNIVREPVSMVGNGAVTILVIAGLFCLAFMLAKNKSARQRVTVAGVLSAGGFAGYQFVLLVFYAFIYKSSIQWGVPDYARYQSSYYAGWFMLALVLLCVSVLQQQECSEEKLPVFTKKAQWITSVLLLGILGIAAAYWLFEWKFGKAEQFQLVPYGLLLAGVLAIVALVWAVPYKKQMGQGLVLLFAMGVGALFVTMVPKGLTMLDYPDRVFAPQQVLTQRVEKLEEKMNQPGRVFYVNQKDNGKNWFVYSYNFLPRILDYSISGGAQLTPPAEGERSEIWQATLPELQQHLKDKNCSYIVIEELDNDFIENYGSIFTDNLESWNGELLLYQRQPDGLYAPV